MANSAPILSGTSARDSNGRVWSWTWDGFDGVDFTSPAQVNLSNVTALAGNTVLRNDGTVWTWRQCCCDNHAVTGLTQVPGLNSVTAIANSTALRNDGTVWTWSWDSLDGLNWALSTPARVPGLDNVTAIAFGTELTALRSDGTVWRWEEDWGDRPATLEQISTFTNVTAITDGALLRSDGTVWAWGTDWYSEFIGPRPVSNLSNVIAIAHGTALRADGTVWQFRWDKLSAYPQAEAFQISNVSNVTAIGSEGWLISVLGPSGYVWVGNPVLMGPAFSYYCEYCCGYEHFPARTELERLSGPGGVGFLNLGTAVQQPPTSPFVDVNPNAWYAEGIDFVFENNIMQGTSATTFAPANNFNREMVVATLFRMYHGRIANVSDSRQSPFTDVPSGEWFAPYVSWGHRAGLVQGTSATRFGTGNPVSRQDFAVFMHRFANYVGDNTGISGGFTLTFPDVGGIDTWAQEPLRWAVYNGLITGTGQLLEPVGTANRAQAATILMRYAQTVAN